MTSRLVDLAITAGDPRRLAEFWARALAWRIPPTPAGDGDVRLLPTDGTRFTISFPPSRIAKSGKNPIHLDLTTTSLDDQAETVRMLLQHGASHVDVGQGDEPHVVLADPEGNEFCVIEPGNAFLAGCGRLGSITCDGSPAVGYFWSSVLGWPLVWDQDDETAIRAPDGNGPFITWGPPVPPMSSESRLYLEVVPDDSDERTEVSRLASLGAALLETGDRAVMADPDGNQFCVLRRGGLTP